MYHIRLFISKASWTKMNTVTDCSIRVSQSKCDQGNLRNPYGAAPGLDDMLLQYKIRI